MNDKPPKIYVPKSKAKVQQTSFGNVLKLGFHAETLIAFCKQHANAAGYINLDVVPRRETDQYGNTHSICLNSWSPGDSARKSHPPTPKPTDPEGDSSVPF